MFKKLYIIFFFRRADKSPTKYSRICSCHFSNGDTSKVPTLFKHNEHITNPTSNPTKRLRYSTAEISSTQNDAKKSETAPQALNLCPSLQEPHCSLANNQSKATQTFENVLDTSALQTHSSVVNDEIKTMLEEIEMLRKESSNKKIFQ